MSAAELHEDLRASLRSLRREPAFTVPALATLALGLGAAAALSGLTHSVLLTPLPFPQAERVQAVWFVSPILPGGLDRVRHSEATYLHWRDRAEAWSDFALAERMTVTLDDGVRAVRMPAARVTSDIHAVLGREAQLGRSLRMEDMAPGAEPVVLLSHAQWDEGFGRRPDIVGTLLTLDGTVRRVVGVLPREVRFPTEDVRLWIPLTIDEARPEAANFIHTGYGRLAPGADAGAAAADFQRLVNLLPEVQPQAFPRALLERAQFRPRIETLPEVMIGQTRTTLALLAVAVLVLLGIAGANVAGLSLVRTDRRLRDLAVRAASGATATRLRRMLLVEHVLLAGLGGVAGLTIAWPLLRLLGGSGAGFLPRLSAVALTPAAGAVTLAAAVALGLLAGLTAASRVRVERLADDLRSGTRAVGAGARSVRLRRLLVAGQVALAVALAMNASLLARSFQRLVSVDTGFSTESVLSAGLAFDTRGYARWDDARTLLLPLMDELAADGGVRAVAISNHLPLRPGRIFWPFVVEDVPETADLPQPQLARVVSEGYFDALGIPLLEGRAFTRDDLYRDGAVAVVSAGLARRWWPEGSALGRRISTRTDAETGARVWLEVVGVVDDVRDRALADAPPGMVYVPFHESHVSNGRWRELALTVAGSDPLARVPALRRALETRDRTIPLFDVRTMEGVLRDFTARDRTVTAILVGAAATALLLAAVGLYGVLSFVVRQRRREIGLRLALGADTRQILRLVLGQAGSLVALGLAAGTGAWLATRGIVARTLFETGPGDPVALVTVLAILAAVATVAAWAPARRAARLSPTLTLKEE